MKRNKLKLKSLQWKVEGFHKFTLVYIYNFIKIILQDFSKMNQWQLKNRLLDKMNRILHLSQCLEKLLFWLFASTKILAKSKRFILIHNDSKFKQFIHAIIWIYTKCCLGERNLTFLTNIQFAVNSQKQLNISIPLALYIWILNQKTLYSIPRNSRKLY